MCLRRGDVPQVRAHSEQQEIKLFTPMAYCSYYTVIFTIVIIDMLLFASLNLPPLTFILILFWFVYLFSGSLGIGH